MKFIYFSKKTFHQIAINVPNIQCIL